MAAPAWIPADTFAARLLHLRLDLDLTIDEAAEQCGLKPRTWGTWERGTTPHNMAEVVAKISAGTGVSKEWLMWGSAGPAVEVTGGYWPGQLDLGLAA